MLEENKIWKSPVFNVTGVLTGAIIVTSFPNYGLETKIVYHLLLE